MSYESYFLCWFLNYQLNAPEKKDHAMESRYNYVLSKVFGGYDE